MPTYFHFQISSLTLASLIYFFTVTCFTAMFCKLFSVRQHAQSQHHTNLCCKFDSDTLQPRFVSMLLLRSLFRLVTAQPKVTQSQFSLSTPAQWFLQYLRLKENPAVNVARSTDCPCIQSCLVVSNYTVFAAK